jgi:hypothetical protein
MPQIPAIWEMEIGKITEASLHQKKKKKLTIPLSQQTTRMWWCKPVIPAMQQENQGLRSCSWQKCESLFRKQRKQKCLGVWGND